MSWTYRIVRTRCGDGFRYAIHEAYYGLGNEEEIDKKTPMEELDKLGISWTESPIAAESFICAGEKDDPEENRADLKIMLKRMLKACDLPIVNEEDTKTYWPK